MEDGIAQRLLAKKALDMGNIFSTWKAELTNSAIMWFWVYSPGVVPLGTVIARLTLSFQDGASQKRQMPSLWYSRELSPEISTGSISNWNKTAPGIVLSGGKKVYSSKAFVDTIPALRMVAV